jgi:NPCBM/NEW2 domain-containing protein
MTNDERSPNDEIRMTKAKGLPPSGFGICHWAFVILSAFVIGHSSFAQDAPVFRLETTAGERFRGPLLGLTEKGSLRLGGARRVRCLADEWLTLRRADIVPPGLPAGPHLLLTNGDCLPLTPATVALTGERLTFTHALLSRGAATRLPLSAVALVWLATPDGADAERFRRQLLAQRRRRDVVRLRNGDVLEGVLSRLDGKGLLLEVGRKKVPVALSRVAVVALSSDLAANLRPRGTHAHLILTDGTRLLLKEVACEDGETLTGTTAFDAAVRVPLAQVAALDYRQGRAVYLSDLKPIRYDFTPYLGVRWPLVTDGSVAGRDLRLGGGVYDKGVGMHSASRVTYSLPPGCKRFEARVGLDDRSGRRGSVRVRVLVDGKERELGIKDELTHGTGPVRLNLDVSGAKELTLLVDFGAAGDVGDHVNWADARLIRGKDQ